MFGFVQSNDPTESRIHYPEAIHSIITRDLTYGIHSLVLFGICFVLVNQVFKRLRQLGPLITC